MAFYRMVTAKQEDSGELIGKPTGALMMPESDQRRITSQVGGEHFEEMVEALLAFLLKGAH